MGDSDAGAAYCVRMGLRISACVAATATLMVCTAPLAAADAVTFTDPRGDAPSRYDLTRTTVTNADGGIVVAQRVRDLRGRRTQIFGFNFSGPGGNGIVHSVRRKDGTVRNRLIGSESGTECEIRARWRLGRDSIRVRLARECIEGGVLRVSTLIGAGNGSAGDPIDWTKTVAVRQG